MCKTHFLRVCAKHIFGGNIYVRSKFPCVRLSHDLCARQSLEGTLLSSQMLGLTHVQGLLRACSGLYQLIEEPLM